MDQENQEKDAQQTKTIGTGEFKPSNCRNNHKSQPNMEKPEEKKVHDRQKLHKK